MNSTNSLISFFLSPNPTLDPTFSCLSLVFNLWQFLSLSFAFMTLTLDVSYFMYDLSILVCLVFFSWFDWGYVLLGRKPQWWYGLLTGSKDKCWLCCITGFIVSPLWSYSCQFNLGKVLCICADILCLLIFSPTAFSILWYTCILNLLWIVLTVW